MEIVKSVGIEIERAWISIGPKKDFPPFLHDGSIFLIVLVDPKDSGKEHPRCATEELLLFFGKHSHHSHIDTSRGPQN